MQRQEGELGTTRIEQSMPTTTKPTAADSVSLPGAKISPSGAGLRFPWRWVVFGIVATLAGADLWWARGPAKAGAQAGRGRGQPPAGISVVTARQGQVGVFVNGLGAVTPIYTVSIKPRIDGELLAVNYVEGQLVNRGDPLVDIDPAPFKALLLQAQGQFDRDTALLENARLDLERYQEAFAKNAIPKQQLDTQRATVHQYEGTVKLDQGQIDTAKVNLAYCHITAPISGRVGLRLVDPGNVVHAADTNPLLVITQLQPISVTFGVDENYLPQILRQLSQGKTLTVEAYDHEDTNKLTDGQLLTFDNQVDPNSGTVKFKAIFRNEDSSLFPNQFVNAHLLVETQHGIVLPTSAIQRNAQGAFVYLVTKSGTNSLVTMKQVAIGASHDDTTIVASGIQSGDMVAADNFNRLQDNAIVFIRTGNGGRRSGGRGAPGDPSRGGGNRRGGGDGERSPDGRGGGSVPGGVGQSHTP